MVRLRLGVPRLTSIPYLRSSQHEARPDDQIPIAGYRLKHLTADERNEIIQGLGSQRDGTPGSPRRTTMLTPIVGAEIPSRIALQGLTAMPDALTAKFPGLRGTAFMRAGGKVLVVDLDNSLVVGAWKERLTIISAFGRTRFMLNTPGILEGDDYAQFLVACLAAILIASGAAIVLNNYRAGFG